MESVAGCAFVGGAVADVDGPSFDRSIVPTHDHPFIKSNMVQWARVPRKLTKIENGVLELSSSRCSKLYMPLFAGKPATYSIQAIPQIRLKGSFSDVQALAERLFALNRSRIGKNFIGYLLGLGDQIELSLFKWEGRVQVLADITNKGRLRGIDEAKAPAEWIGKVDRDRCDAFLAKIRAGTASFEIDRGHPQRDQILYHLQELSMRSIGVHFLLNFQQLDKPIKIGYEPGCNYVGMKYQKGVSVLIDCSVKGYHFGGLAKGSNQIIPLPIHAKYILAHELIHALHILIREFRKAPDMTQYLAKIVSYNPMKKSYEIDNPMAFLNGHTSFEEQHTITGQWIVTENAFRYLFFDPLRWGHECYELLIKKYPHSLTEFFVDPCAPGGELNRVALMILRHEVGYAPTILPDASKKEIDDGLLQAKKRLLSDLQIQVLKVVEDYSLKLSGR